MPSLLSGWLSATDQFAEWIEQPYDSDTDLLIAEATLPRPERTGLRGHLTPEEAGEHARDAGARKLMLTHISDELDPDWAVTQAKTAYDGPVEMAAEGKSVHV